MFTLPAVVMADQGQKRPGVLFIPPPLWHGTAVVGPTSASLLYYATTVFNPGQPNEHRILRDAVRGIP